MGGTNTSLYSCEWPVLWTHAHVNLDMNNMSPRAMFKSSMTWLHIIQRLRISDHNNSIDINSIRKKSFLQIQGIGKSGMVPKDNKIHKRPQQTECSPTSTGLMNTLKKKFNQIYCSLFSHLRKNKAWLFGNICQHKRNIEKNAIAEQLFTTSQETKFKKISANKSLCQFQRKHRQVSKWALSYITKLW